MSRRAERIAATRSAIASNAARLALEQGVEATTVAQIIESADVGRTTFFRYFDAKELAIAEGVAGNWGDVVVEAIRRQPADLHALAAVRAAFLEMRPWFPQIEDQLREYLRMASESRSVHAWILAIEELVEQAIAGAVEERFDDLDPVHPDGDPRPHLVGSLTLASARFAMQRWLDSDGEADLHGLMQAALGCMEMT